MKNVLVINSSLNGESGNSNKMTTKFMEQVQQRQQVQVTSIDLQSLNLPHLSTDEMQTWGIPADERTPEEHKLAAISDNLIEQISWADVIVVGMPMYNFGVPSTFKAWIDRVARAGVTFRYTETGPEGLLKNKQVYVMAARGGVYEGTAKDSQSVYLRDVFNFLGIEDVYFIYAEGLAMGPEAAELAWSKINEKYFELIENMKD
ncbi:NAD(P)H-dependent oxidoreductase [Paraneptunicella aestuarii]|uniref:FMN-dependent NADH-azoreductase n=1 Tax=Paraneptunicella aestuarii TaxID=2831148 RepID=UPI001E492EDB|nr:NAD(P)H-dependent oxidoreductase [Paraneptunicella aestuarii]UAA40167.1 NAD(P)H-dependent oxidoreductase [Paraneptunicella aestuarii]